MQKIRSKIIFLALMVSVAASAIQNVNAQALIDSTTPTLFTNDLGLGSTGDDVRRLQQYLNTHGFALSEAGVGSLGQETVYFGLLTKNALMRFQDKYSKEILAPLGLTNPTGNFYSGTRSFINSLLLSTNNYTSGQYTQINHRRSGRIIADSHYTVTSSGSDTVSVSPIGSQVVTSGGTSSFTVTADDGYTVTTSVGGTCPLGVWSGSTYTTGEITESCSVSFSADINTYAVTLSGSGISPTGVETVSHGSGQAFTVTTGLGYGFGTIGGTCPAGSWVHATYTTGTVTTPCSVLFSAATIGASVGSTIATSGSLFFRQNGANFEYSLNGTEWDSSLLPSITNIGGGTLTIYLVGDFTISNANSYIIVDSDNITIQGETGIEGPTIITVNGVTDYPGFIRNGSNTSPGYNNITISNVFVNTLDSTLAEGGGWLAQAHFGNGAANNTISSCGSNGPISQNSGGVVGANSSHVNISNCFTSGSIGTNAGGIVGAESDSVVVSDSYSLGEIGLGAGGIVGAYAIDSVVQNTYSTGLVGTNAGGIIGSSYTGQTVLNSYTSGTSLGTGGIVAGSALDGLNNYSESNNSGSGWNSTNAAAVLTGINTTWKSVALNNPYRLMSFSASPYSDSTQTISAGQSSSSVFGYYNTCSIVSVSGGSSGSYADITINADTGVISTTSDVLGGTYTILISCSTIHGTYALSTLELTVN